MKRIIATFLKRILAQKGLRITKIENTKSESIILTDVFNSGFEKKVLISYIQQPFIDGIKFHHSNYLECFTAAEIFHKLGYSVDVINLFDETTQINYAEYVAIYGLGRPLEKAYYSENPEKLLKIFYSTGCNPSYSYKVSALQVQRFYFQTGKLIPESSRIISDFWTFQYLLADFIIALGNDFVAKTFLDVNPSLKCEPVPAFYFDVYDIDLRTKKIQNAKKHFLWFGSSGLLHKGLDLLLDIFSQRDDITLHICGQTSPEIKFREYYNTIISSSHNIIDHGFVEIHSDKFRQLMDECAFAVFPTVSEGGSPALLNVMANGGLIPLASYECGIDIDELGFKFSQLDHPSILKIIDEVNDLPDLVLQEKAMHVKEIVRANYSYDLYKKNLSEKISKAISLFNSK